MTDRILIKDAIVLTQDRALGELPKADVLVEDGKRNVMLCNWSSSCKDALISKTAKTATYRAIVSKGGRGRAVASSAPVTIEWTAATTGQPRAVASISARP